MSLCSFGVIKIYKWRIFLAMLRLLLSFTVLEQKTQLSSYIKIFEESEHIWVVFAQFPLYYTKFVEQRRSSAVVVFCTRLSPYIPPSGQLHEHWELDRDSGKTERVWIGLCYMGALRVQHNSGGRDSCRTCQWRIWIRPTEMTDSAVADRSRSTSCNSPSGRIWLRGTVIERPSYDRRTFPVLRSTCSWRVTTYVTWW